MVWLDKNDPRLFARSAVPSITGILVCLTIGILIVAAHVLLLGLSGKAFPVNVDDVLLQGYANYIVGPLTTAINSGVFTVMLLMLLWGGFGFIVYEIIVHAVMFLQEWRSEAHEITVPSEGVVRRHPLEGSFWLHAAWRMFVVILSLFYTVAILPIVHFCLTNDEQLLAATSTTEALPLVGITLALWTCLLHGYVVLIRLYMFRTRVTGEIIY